MNLSKVIFTFVFLVAFSATATAGKTNRDRRSADKRSADKRSADKRSADKRSADKRSADKRSADERRSKRRSLVANLPARVKQYDFEGDELDGELARPDGDELTARPPGTFSSLIRLRTSFVPEVVAQAEDLVHR